MSSNNDCAISFGFREIENPDGWVQLNLTVALLFFLNIF